MKSIGIIFLFVLFANLGFGQTTKTFDAIEVKEKPVIDSLIIKFIGSHKWRSKNSPNFLLIVGSIKESDLVDFDLSYIDSLQNGNVYATAPVILKEKNLRYFNFDNHLVFVLGDNDPLGLITDTYKRKQYNVYIDNYIPDLFLESGGGLYTYKDGKIEDFPGIAYHDFGTHIKANNDSPRIVLRETTNFLQTKKIIYIPLVKEKHVIDSLIKGYKNSRFKNRFNKNSSVFIHLNNENGQPFSFTFSIDSVHKKIIYSADQYLFEDKSLRCFKYRDHFIFVLGEYDPYNLFKLTSKKKQFTVIPINRTARYDFDGAYLYNFENGKFKTVGYFTKK